MDGALRIRVMRNKEQQVPPLHRPLRLRSGSGSGRDDRSVCSEWIVLHTYLGFDLWGIKVKVKGSGRGCPLYTSKIPPLLMHVVCVITCRA